MAGCDAFSCEKIQVVYTGLSGIDLVAYGIADYKTGDLVGLDKEKRLEHSMKITEDSTSSIDR